MDVVFVWVLRSWRGCGCLSRGKTILACVMWSWPDVECRDVGAGVMPGHHGLGFRKAVLVYVF